MHSFSLLVAIILVVSSNGNVIPEDNCATVQESPVVNTESDDYRLPGNIVPVSYKILVSPELEGNFTFDGESEIVIEVIAETDRIVLHAKNLTIKNTTLLGPDGESMVAEPAALNTTNDFLVINVGTELLPGTNYTLKFVFEGQLNDDGEGFYRISYEGDHGELRWSAATNSKYTNARRAFPCWDEPHLKATFDVSIRHRKDLHAISNMHAIATEVDQTDSTHNITTFATTPKMSTYLVAFVVTDYEPSSNVDKSFTIWTKPNDAQRANFIVNFAGEILKEIESYTGIPYASHGFEKMDAVALYPFSPIVGVENWGVITFQDNWLSESVVPNPSYGAFNMMYTLVSQWFGNLVTPKRWQYFGLSEGLSAYFTFEMADKIWPQWRYKDVQVVKYLQGQGFRDESWPAAVAMNHNVHSPTEITEKYNDHSSVQAFSVIRMIAHVLGETKFQIAVKKYLNKMKFKAATPDDLFEEFVKVFPTITGSTVEPVDILNHWSNTPGFPVINVTRDYENKNTVNITQKRFLDEVDPAHNETYYVPINYATQGRMDFDDTTVTHWLDKDRPVTEIEGNFTKNEWIIVNKQQFGYYRVNYDEQNWNMIADFLQSKDYTDIHVINRAQIVDDSLALARNGQLRWEVAFNVIQFLKQEVDYVPWYPALRHLKEIPTYFANTDLDRSLKNYILELTEDVLRNLTLNESFEAVEYTEEMRGMIVEIACRVGAKSCRDIATTKLINWLENLERGVSTYLSPDVICPGLIYADQATWMKFFAHYLNKAHTMEQDFYANVLGCTSDVQILNVCLSKSLDEFLAPHHRRTVFSTAIQLNAVDVNVVLDFIITNADRIYEVAGNSTKELERYIRQIGNVIGTEAQLNKLESATNEHVKSASAGGIEVARKRLELLNLQIKGLVQFFERKSAIPSK